LNKKGLREHSEGENFECPELEETIDVATLPLARSTTVLSENGKKRVITMGDPVVQRFNIHVQYMSKYFMYIYVQVS
jgi:hypothetical protein